MSSHSEERRISGPVRNFGLQTSFCKFACGLRMTLISHDGLGGFDHLPRRRRDVPRRDSVGLEQVVVWRGLAIDVAQTDAAHRRWATLAEHLGHGAAEPADDRVVL